MILLLILLMILLICAPDTVGAIISGVVFAIVWLLSAGILVLMVLVGLVFVMALV